MPATPRQPARPVRLPTDGCGRHPTGAARNRHPTGAVRNRHPTGAVRNRHPTGAVRNRHSIGPVRDWRPIGAARLAALLVLALGGVTACTGLDQASAAGIADEALVSEAADRVAAADALTWTATYRLAGGATARVVRSQSPSRIAYSWPSGSLISTPDAVTRCDGSGGKAVCTATAPDADETIPASTGLITPSAILDMLEVAAIDPGVEVVPRETTIAGRYASCLKFGAGFEVCVTGEGTVAAFTGTVEGTPVEMLLTGYSSGTDEADFTVPPDAHLDDRRPA
ncbi:hypothetical protein [Actinoplanes philippinensis]|uniref:hypothetical protein n=1 Tax=Actinoplanes philippinensis TaxID=35752 RepID=UPI0033D93D8A